MLSWAEHDKSFITSGPGWKKTKAGVKDAQQLVNG